MRLHRRGNDRPFSHTNLVPAPRPELWQDAPHSPLRQLETADARGRLALGKLISSMEDAVTGSGQHAYAYTEGETSFVRRNPQKIAATLAFVLGKDEGEWLKLKPDEAACLKECLWFLREHNPHFRQFLTVWEAYAFPNGCVHSVVPTGHGDTPVQPARGGARRQRRVETRIADTLGNDEVALVVIDPAEGPRTWAEIENTDPTIGEAAGRRNSEIEGPAAGAPPREAGARADPEGAETARRGPRGWGPP